MGSGKTTLAKKLANKMGMQFIDLDELIELRAGKSISDIFAIEGEEKFRLLEHECLKDSVLRENAVIAVGGGTPCFFDNMDIINRNGVSVYLKMNSAMLVSRLNNSKNKRPLLKDIANNDELKQRIDELLAVREKYYLQSRLIFEEKNLNVKKIIEMLNDPAIGLEIPTR